MSSNINILLEKLDSFIRKYYKNQVLRGSIYSVSSVLLFFLCISVLEYYAHFDTSVRTILFYAFILTNGFIITKLIILPLLKMNKLGKVLSYEQASEIIGKHFSNVQDKLLNVLQLYKEQGSLSSHTPHMSNPALALAAIEQKTNELKPIPFTSAINLSENKKYLKYALGPIMVFLFILFAAPSILKDGSKRIVNHKTYYEKEAPFQFNIINNELKAVQQDDFELRLKLTGNEVPENVYIEIEGNEFKLNKESTIEFSYTFKNIQKSIPFHFNADGFSSKEYELTAVPNPILLSFNINLSYPKYLGKKDETVRNTGDLLIPAGTKITWDFNTQNTNKLRLSFKDTLINLSPSGENKYTYNTRAMNDARYAITTSNEFVSSNDSVQYSISVIQDQYPMIQMEEKIDSVLSKLHYFKGVVKDDYGFTSLNFNYRFINKTDTSSNPKSHTSTLKSISIPISKTLNQDQFFYQWDMNTIDVQSGDAIEYYFEVWDNDGVHGAKSAKTQKMVFKAPSLKEIAENTDKNNSEIKADLKESIQDAKDLQKQLAELNKKIMEKKDIGWEEKKKLQELLEKQKDLQEKVESIKNQNQQNNVQQSEFKPVDPQVAEKQKQLQDLMEQVMTPEMKEKMKELEKLLSQMDKQKMQVELEKLKTNSKEMEKELDRTLEAFKRMEVEQKMQENIEKLDELKKKQDELADKTEGKKLTQKEIEQKQQELDKKINELQKQLKEEALKNNDNVDKNELAKKLDNLDKQIQKLESEKQELTQKNNDKKADSKELEQKQNELNKQFEDVKKDIQDMEKKNQALEEPMKLDDTQQKQNEIQQEMQNSSQELNKNQKSKAAKSQKSAAEKMEQMAQQMKQNQEQMQQEQSAEDLDALRDILENLVHLSFDQEKLMGTLQKTRTDNPQYPKIAQQQKKLQDDSKMIEDSLLALAKRQPSIKSVVLKEIGGIQMNMEKAISSLAERQTSEGASRMQFSMTSINNLALMLNEASENMMKQMAQSKPGSGSCKKPGGKGQQKPSMSNLRQMQQQLNERIKQLKEQMAKGQQGKKGQDGKGGPNGQQGMSEQLAKLAAEQEYIRRQMQGAQEGNEGKDGGKKPGGDAAKKMEETETDLVNKLISQETIKRQEEILSKLLEYEKAEKEREMENKRESTEAKDQFTKTSKQYEEYKKMKEKELELLKTVPPSLIPFYKMKINEYFNNFGGQ